MEAYRENQEWSLLASYYDTLGNQELRDKYIELALSGNDATDFDVIHLRSMQGRLDLIPPGVIDHEAARYLRELAEEKLVEELYVIALRKATDEGDLWWQVRALQDLGWQSELDALVLANADEIEHSADPTLLMLLESARGNDAAAKDLLVRMAKGTRSEGAIVFTPSLIDDEDADASSK